MSITDRLRRINWLPLVVLLIIGGIVFGATHESPLRPTPTPIVHYRQDAPVVAVMQRLGLDYSRLNLIYGQDPHHDNQAIFNSPNTIYVSPEIDPSKLNLILSHEYIHYAQLNLDQAGASTFYPYVMALSDTNEHLHSRKADFASHLCKECSLDWEIEAVACTELPDSALRDDFIAWCNKYLPKRNELVNQ
jgi:hypothetical protein